MTNDLLTLPQAATALGMDRSAVFRVVKAGKLPAVRIGRDWLVTRADVEAYRVAPKHAGGRPRRPRPAAAAGPRPG